MLLFFNRNLISKGKAVKAITLSTSVENSLYFSRDRGDWNVEGSILADD
jgi:hypothetical protein